MPNVAQEYPCLLFLPFFVFAAVALFAGVIHLAVLFEARITARRLAQAAASRDAIARPRSLDPVPAAQPGMPARIRLVSTKA